nr:myosin-15 isoform X1 [Tanacetum cinerariifolium]
MNHVSRSILVLAFAEKLLLGDADVTYGGLDNMTRLDYLNEPTVLDNLKKRHAVHEIFVYNQGVCFFILFHWRHRNLL